MKTLTLPSPAKLNLFLHITGRRPDGYHELQTLFQLLDYGDQLSYTLRDDDNITLHPAIEGVNYDENLIVQSAKLLRQETGSHQGVDITLKKILPMGGGLGGGSSNAATTLLALNKLWSLELSIDKLAELGQRLGADVPVFVRGHSAWAEGIGEQLQALNIPECWYLVVKPACNIATAEIFSNKQLTRNTSAITIAAVFEEGHRNDCEPVAKALYPEIDQALKWLGKYSQAQLTGTGACIFARFADKASAQQVYDELPAELTGFIARGVNQSPCHRALAL